MREIPPWRDKEQVKEGYYEQLLDFTLWCHENKISVAGTLRELLSGFMQKKQDLPDLPPVPKFVDEPDRPPEKEIVYKTKIVEKIVERVVVKEVVVEKVVIKEVIVYKDRPVRFTEESPMATPKRVLDVLGRFHTALASDKLASAMVPLPLMAAVSQLMAEIPLAIPGGDPMAVPRPDAPSPCEYCHDNPGQQETGYCRVCHRGSPLHVVWVTKALTLVELQSKGMISQMALPSTVGVDWKTEQAHMLKELQHHQQISQRIADENSTSATVEVKPFPVEVDDDINKMLRFYDIGTGTKLSDISTMPGSKVLTMMGQAILTFATVTDRMVPGPGPGGQERLEQLTATLRETSKTLTDCVGDLPRISVTIRARNVDPESSAVQVAATAAEEAAEQKKAAKKLARRAKFEAKMKDPVYAAAHKEKMAKMFRLRDESFRRRREGQAPAAVAVEQSGDGDPDDDAADE